jgi:hypothetical protein
MKFIDLDRYGSHLKPMFACWSVGSLVSNTIAAGWQDNKRGKNHPCGQKLLGDRV